MEERVQAHCESIAQRLTNGYEGELNEDGEPLTAFDWLAGVYDIQYTVTREREYLHARVLVAFGGPNIWVDTRGFVEGAWWGDKGYASFEDTLGIDEACRELFNC